MQGLSGIRNLTDLPWVRRFTAVWDEMVSNLRSVGYEPSILKAAAYDWRLGLSDLERRDSYYSGYKAMIEAMYSKSGKPVVIVAHSMGNRVTQYFYRWMQNELGEKDAQEWLDTRIHAHVALGAPFLGASGTMRLLLTGTGSGLEAVLSQAEALKCSRTGNSGLQLLPLHHELLPHPAAFISRPSGQRRQRSMEKVVEVASPSRLRAVSGPSDCDWSPYQSGRYRPDSLTQQAVALFQDAFEGMDFAAEWGGMAWDVLEPERISGLWRTCADVSMPVVSLFQCVVDDLTTSSLSVLEDDWNEMALKISPFQYGVKVKSYARFSRKFTREVLYFHQACPIQSQLLGSVSMHSFFQLGGRALVSISLLEDTLFAVMTRYSRSTDRLVRRYPCFRVRNVLSCFSFQGADDHGEAQGRGANDGAQGDGALQHRPVGHVRRDETAVALHRGAVARGERRCGARCGSRGAVLGERAWGANGSAERRCSFCAVI